MTFRIQPTYEQVITPPTETPTDHTVAPLPEAVQTWLEDLLLLRGVPLHYILPHPNLLPPESIRFFHIDPSWTARLIEGALNAACVGGGQVALSREMVAYIRQRVALRLAERLFKDAPANQPPPTLPQLSGMLIRSDIIRRWPGLNITAKEGQIALTLARKERLASGLMIVIFAGIPDIVEITEPFEGTRFGVERYQQNDYRLQVRKDDGSFAPGEISVQFRSPNSTVLDIGQLANQVHTKLGLTSSTPLGSARLSLSLQQQPFKQIFGGADAAETTRLQRIENDLAALQSGGGT